MNNEGREEHSLTSSPHGSNDVSGQETDLDGTIADFEKLIDKNDPEQVKMLEEMKKHTAMLHRARGDWNKPNTFRHWNDPAPKNLPKGLPMASETYRKYKNHLIEESHPLELVAQGIAPKLIAPAKDSDSSIVPRETLQLPASEANDVLDS
ncbi:hypothetical protein PSENEW3_00004423 [Picochlorum sp. SENEW3]|nr:hypothetical protein PSENEW3_00004423 [Picochlorum sp. SENEW3]